MKTILLLAEHMIHLLKLLHLKGVVHRDIKPENFLIGRQGNEDKIYLVDFGLSKKYLIQGKHIQFKQL